VQLYVSCGVIKHCAVYFDTAICSVMNHVVESFRSVVTVAHFSAACFSSDNCPTRHVHIRSFCSSTAIKFSNMRNIGEFDVALFASICH